MGEFTQEASQLKLTCGADIGKNTRAGKVLVVTPHPLGAIGFADKPKSFVSLLSLTPPREVSFLRLYIDAFFPTFQPLGQKGHAFGRQRHRPKCFRVIRVPIIKGVEKGTRVVGGLQRTLFAISLRLKE